MYSTGCTKPFLLLGDMFLRGGRQTFYNWYYTLNLHLYTMYVFKDTLNHPSSPNKLDGSYAIFFIKQKFKPYKFGLFKKTL